MCSRSLKLQLPISPTSNPLCVQARHIHGAVEAHTQPPINSRQTYRERQLMFPRSVVRSAMRAGGGTNTENSSSLIRIRLRESIESRVRKAWRVTAVVDVSKRRRVEERKMFLRTI